MTDWDKVILTVEPKSKPDIRAGLADSMGDVVSHAALTTNLRLAHFLAQISHESDGLKTTREYWGPTAAQARYEGRRDLGNIRPGDGKRFMGRGLLQITGRANYSRLGKVFGVDLEADPDAAARFPIAAMTAAEYWRDRKINAAADADDVRRVTKIINGGQNGLADRAVRLARAKHALSGFPPSTVANSIRIEAAREASAGKQRTGQAKAVGAVALTSQTAHAAPEAAQSAGIWQPLAIVGIGLALVVIAVLAVRKAKDHAQVAQALEQAAEGTNNG